MLLFYRQCLICWRNPLCPSTPSSSGVSTFSRRLRSWIIWIRYGDINNRFSLQLLSADISVPRLDWRLGGIRSSCKPLNSPQLPSLTHFIIRSHINPRLLSLQWFFSDSDQLQITVSSSSESTDLRDLFFRFFLPARSALAIQNGPSHWKSSHT